VNETVEGMTMMKEEKPNVLLLMIIEGE